MYPLFPENPCPAIKDNVYQSVNRNAVEQGFKNYQVLLYFPGAVQEGVELRAKFLFLVVLRTTDVLSEQRGFYQTPFFNVRIKSHNSPVDPVYGLVKCCVVRHGRKRLKCCKRPEIHAENVLPILKIVSNVRFQANRGTLFCIF